MLALFPGILFLAPFAATILRIIAGFFFLYSAYVFFSKRVLISHERVFIVGRMRLWMVYVLSLITVVTALGLLAGFETQLAGILGILIALKYLFFPEHLARISPFQKSTYFLLLIICVTLLLSGAGPLGFDLPL